MSPVSPSIVVKGLSFRYRGRRRATLQDVSFAVSPGEMLLILGPSGCGKSTLALCLNGLIPHGIDGEMSGEVRVAGHDVRDTPVSEMARSVGMVFQDADTQFCMLRVDDEVAFGLENLRVPRGEMLARIRSALETVGLAGDERTRIDRLSGGARQRLALACVLAMEPSVVVFDEPTSNLDPVGAEEVFAVISRLRARGGHTIVVVEHRLDHLIGFVDRILMLGRDGTVQASGSPVEVLRDHGDELDVAGVWVPQVGELVHRLVKRGLSIDSYPLSVDQAVDTLSGLLARSGREGRVVKNEPFEECPPDPAMPSDLTPPAHRCATHDASPWSAQDSPARSAAIEISGLSYRYPTGREALRDVSLTIPEGSFYALVGPNGAGKSTLASHLIGSIRPTPGAVHLFGHDVRSMAPSELAEWVGYVFQNPEHQFVAGTVFEELAFGLRVRGRPEAEIKERVDVLLDEFGLSALAPANPFTLSHGEKRRLSVASMLILGQRILVLDEPTFGQDRRNTTALMEMLARLNEAGRTIVMITHDVRLVAEYARRVGVLVDGSLAFQGEPDQLFGHPSMLERGHLVVPPILELSRRLNNADRSFPVVATVSRAAEALDRRLDLVPGGRRSLVRP